MRVIFERKSRELLRKEIGLRVLHRHLRSLLNELAIVLRRPKFKTTEDEVHRIVLALRMTVKVVNVKSKIRVLKEES